MPANRNTIDVTLVTRLIASQFPQWADLPVRPVDVSGWDNRTFRLGEGMSVRLPSAEGYILQVEKEQRWLPVLAPELPLPIPIPLAKGVPGEGYPFPWSVYGWLEGETAAAGHVDDLDAFARALADFLTTLYRIDPSGGPEPGPHTFFRGGPLSVYDADTRRALTALHGEVDTALCREVWESALTTSWQGAGVWFHGDVASGNLLVRGGRLAAVIDFGVAGVGDPSCDLAIAWTLLTGPSRAVFRGGLELDDATWARGRGWALWKALITLAEYLHTDPSRATDARQVITEVSTDFQRSR